MHVCTSLQTDNHASTPPLCFLQAGCPSCRPTNSVKALKAQILQRSYEYFNSILHVIIVIIKWSATDAAQQMVKHPIPQRSVSWSRKDDVLG